MEGFFGLGIPELILVFVLALILLGPQDMVKTARTLGRAISHFVKSPLWRQFLDTTRTLSELPTQIVREAGLEEDMQNLKKAGRDLRVEFKEAARPVTEELNATGQILSAERKAALAAAKEALPAAQELAVPGPSLPAAVKPEPAPTGGTFFTPQPPAATVEDDPGQYDI